MPDPTLAQHLQATKEQLQRRGRCTYGAANEQGNICLIYAAVLAKHQLRSPIENGCLWEALEPHIPGGLTRHWNGNLNIVAWNEDPDTTDDDVYNAIDKALAELGALA